MEKFFEQTLLKLMIQHFRIYCLKITLSVVTGKTSIIMLLKSLKVRNKISGDWWLIFCTLRKKYTTFVTKKFYIQQEVLQ